MENKINISKIYFLISIILFSTNIVIGILGIIDTIYYIAYLYRILINYGTVIVLYSSFFSFLLILIGLTLLFVPFPKNKKKKLLIIGLILNIFVLLLASMVTV